MAALVILVNADPDVLWRTDALLSADGHLVAAVSSLAEAKKLLDSVTPDVLVADVRLGMYNGLQLAIRSRLDHPNLPVIITNEWPDATFEAEAKRQGAIFVARQPRVPAHRAHSDRAEPPDTAGDPAMAA
jgi:DNA-binding NtrC family response regulator